jgi:DNA-binding GntR family transcriptional regulator
MHRNFYVERLTATQILAYILRSISEDRSEEQIAERFASDIKIVKTWIETLEQIHFITINPFNELVVTQSGRNYLQEFNPHW